MTAEVRRDLEAAARIAQAWLDAHKGKTLPQMRLAANRESLDRAEKGLAADPSSRVLQDTVKYLKERRAVLEAHS